MTYRQSSIRASRFNHNRKSVALSLATLAVALAQPSLTHAQRVFGIDTSSAANSVAPSQTYWNRAISDADGDGIAWTFAFVRSSRGGTVDQRVDDTHFYSNISRATTAGLLTGSYHYTRPDSAAHTATDDANHYLEIAGMYMKPGYLLPVFDLEAGNTAHTTASLTAWGMEFMNTIFNAKGILPIVYTNSSYNNDEVNAQLAFNNFGSTPKSSPRTYQWLARPSGDLQTDHPGAATNYPNPYGVWDPNFVTRTNSRDPAVKPWAFWQNGSGYLEPSGASGNRFLVDYNAANGNIEFVKDFLVPALWTAAGPGDWGTTSNWNSDNPDYDGTIQSGPAPRLPNNANLDWVKLQNPNNATVTISSGARTVRKFYTQQPLNITGGSLSVSYLPGSGGQFDVPSEFKSAVTLSPGASYSAHTTLINNPGSLNLNGGTLTFTDIQLASHASTPGKIVMNGNATFAPTGGTGPAIIRSTGSLAQPGTLSLASDSTLTVNNGSSNLDLDIRALVSGSGRLTKSGPGTLRLARSNTYSGGTTVSAGTLSVTADNRLGQTPVSNDSDNLILDGGTLRTGAEINSITLTSSGTNNNYASFPNLTITGAGPDNVPASANVLAGVRTIQVTSGGSGYVNQSPSSPPTANTAGTFVDIIGGGGSGATAYATVSGGVVTSITIANQGNGYTSMPTIHISSTAISGIAGSGASASVSGIALKSIALNDAGFDYTNPTLTFTGGSPSGTGAAATASSTPNWSLNSTRGITLTANGGTLYQTANSHLSYAGSITGSGPLTKSGLGTLTLSGSHSYTGPTTVSAGTLNLTQSLATNAPLTIAKDAKATLTPHNAAPTKTLQFSTLALVVNGTLDLSDNDLLLSDLTLAPTLRSYLSSAYASAAWTGAGLTSSTVAADPTDLSALAYLNNGTHILVTTTYAGDANVNGLIDLDDFALTDKGFATGGTLWWEGDYNYDGTVNALDYALLDRSFALQSGPLSPAFLAQRTAQFGPDYTAHLLASIPEPSSLLAACGLALPLLRRRK